MKSMCRLTAIIEHEEDVYVATERARRLHSEVFVTRVEVAVG